MNAYSKIRYLETISAMPIYRDTLTEKTRIYSVSDLNQASRHLLENHFASIQVEGEISNLVQAASGHYYFKLKDEKAAIQCAFFKGRASRLNFKPENGQQLLARAKVSLYEARGDYQLIIESLEPAGIGLLQQKFNALKEKLQKQGFFEADRKKTLPTLPNQIGIITSPKGAALHDILSTLKRRFDAIPVILYPTEVQGDRAASRIVNAIQKANQRRECDVLILARGGGSIEDLWSFNEETVGMAIVESQIPIVSGVGHEIDFTIADFCADLRAPTPTAAAESVTPELDSFLETLVSTHHTLCTLIGNQLDRLNEKLQFYQVRLKAPAHLLNQYYQTVDKARQALSFLMNQTLLRYRHSIQTLDSRLQKQSCEVKLVKQKDRLIHLRHTLLTHINKHLQTYQHSLERLGATLHATSPLATLNRGYSLTLTEAKQVVMEAKQLTIGDSFWVKLKKGELHAELKDIIQ